MPKEALFERVLQLRDGDRLPSLTRNWYRFPYLKLGHLDCPPGIVFGRSDEIRGFCLMSFVTFLTCTTQPH